MRGSVVGTIIFPSKRWSALALAAPIAVGVLTSATGAAAQGWDSRLYYSPQLFSPANPLEAPAREYSGIPIAGWMLYASVLSGAVYDDNVFQTHDSQTEAWGLRLQPNLEVTRNNGIHKTTIYGFADARFYGEDADEGDVFNAKGGFNHVWEAQRDFIVRFEGDASRKTDINNSGQVIVNGVEQTLVDPLTYNEYRGMVSGLKSFDRFFVGLAGEVARNTYEDIEDSLGQTIAQDYRNQTTYTFSGRVGIHLSPVFYAFTEPSQNWRRFKDETFDSSGQRIVAGIGTDRISLFQGEVFAGYQRQDYDTAAFGEVESDVYGGQLYWYPTRDLTIGVEVDKSIGDSTLSSPGNASGSPVEDTGILVRTEYILSDIWSFSGRAAYDFIDYTATTRQDDRWLAGTTVRYYIWRNLALTFDYQYINLESNITANSFDRNMFTFGGTYKF